MVRNEVGSGGYQPFGDGILPTGQWPLCQV